MFYFHLNWSMSEIYAAYSWKSIFLAAFLPNLESVSISVYTCCSSFSILPSFCKIMFSYYNRDLILRFWSYFLLHMILTKANSDMDANMKTVIPKNQISLAFIYDTFGKFFDWPDDSVMNVSIVDVPVKHMIIIRSKI